MQTSGEPKTSYHLAKRLIGITTIFNSSAYVFTLSHLPWVVTCTLYHKTKGLNNESQKNYEGLNNIQMLYNADK
jgi:hypothetical protein